MSTQIEILVDLYKLKDEFERDYRAARNQRFTVLQSIGVQKFDVAMHAIDTAEQWVEQTKGQKASLKDILSRKLYQYLVSDTGDPMALVEARFPNDPLKQGAFLEDLMRKVKLASAR